jgi:hypothetical protein
MYRRMSVRHLSVAFWAATLLMGCFGMFNFIDFLSFPTEPKHTTLSEASLLIPIRGKNWVILDDIQWDCSHIFYEETSSGRENTKTVYTHIIFTNKNNSIWGVAKIIHKLPCAEILRKEKEANGVLNFVDDWERAYLTDHHLNISKYETNGKFLSFCTDCEKNTSLTIALIGLGTALVLLIPAAFFSYFALLSFKH